MSKKAPSARSGNSFPLGASEQLDTDHVCCCKALICHESAEL